jgi:hypothetical protein
MGSRSVTLGMRAITVGVVPQVVGTHALDPADGIGGCPGVGEILSP